MLNVERVYLTNKLPQLTAWSRPYVKLLKIGNMIFNDCYMSKDLYGINLICSGIWKRNKLKSKLKK